MKSSLSIFVLLVILLPGVTHGQDKSTYYTVMHPDEFTIDWNSWYEKWEQLTAEVRDEYPHHLDLAYGEDPKQKLDLYIPKDNSKDAPVFLFLHGGGMREGDRAQYGYLARPFLKNGIVVALASYRLTPKNTYPDQPNDSRDAVAWLYKNAASYGGSPRNLYVGGHSAGGHLSGLICANTDWLPKRSVPRDALRGCVPMSSNYGFEAIQKRTRYLPDASDHKEATPILNIKNPPPYFVVAAGGDEDRLIEPTKEFAAKLSEAGSTAVVVFGEDMDHAEIVAVLGDSDSKLFKAVFEMIQSAQKGT